MEIYNMGEGGKKKNKTNWNKEGLVRNRTK